MQVFCVVLFGIFSLAEGDSKRTMGPRPVVLWHGHGSSAESNYVEYMKKLIKREIRGVYVLALQLGENDVEDLVNSEQLNLYEQVAYGCRLIMADVKLQDGYNAVGISQGGLLMRALAQKCPQPPIFNLISLGGPQQGIYGIPGNSFTDKFLDFFARYTILPRWELVKRNRAALGYWHDPTSLEDKKYREENNFIAELNNESDPVNDYYKQNLLSLQNLVLVHYTRDEIVLPPASQWFGFYKPGQARKILTLEESRLWKEDRLGLRQLSEEGRLHKLEVNAGHGEHSEEWFTNEIMLKFLT